MPEATTNRQVGVFIVGELVGDPTEGRAYTDRTGAVHTPGVVDLLIGRNVERVEFPNLGAAQAALAGAQSREIVTIPVYANGPWDAANNRRGRVSYRVRTE